MIYTPLHVTHILNWYKESMKMNILPLWWGASLPPTSANRGHTQVKGLPVVLLCYRLVANRVQHNISIECDSRIFDVLHNKSGWFKCTLIISPSAHLHCHHPQCPHFSSLHFIPTFARSPFIHQPCPSSPLFLVIWFVTPVPVFNFLFFFSPFFLHVILCFVVCLSRGRRLTVGWLCVCFPCVVTVGVI